MLLADLGDLLASGTTGVVGTDIFLGMLPDTPAACWAVFETGGAGPEYTMQGESPIETPSVQLLARAATYATARLKANQAFRVLSGLRTRTINSVMYHWAEALQSPFLLERDDHDRPVVVCNYLLRKAVSTG